MTRTKSVCSFEKTPLLGIKTYESPCTVDVTSKNELEELTKQNRTIPSMNMTVFTVWYILIYAGFWGLSTLQSTMNAPGGLGSISQAVLYACSMLSSVLMPELLIEKCGCKMVLIIGSLACCAYVAGNAKLRADTIILTSALFGLLNGPFSAAQALYVDEMAREFHKSSVTKSSMAFKNSMTSTKKNAMATSENTLVATQLTLSDTKNTVTTTKITVSDTKNIPSDTKITRAETENTKISTKNTMELIMAVFFGALALSIEASTAVGNLVSFLILRPAVRTTSVSRHGNVSFHPKCGVRFYPEDEENQFNMYLVPPTELQRVHLISILLVMGLASTVLMMFFMDPLKNDAKCVPGRSFCSSFLSFLELLKNPDQLLLIPISIYIGVESVFYANEFTEAYIACSWGVHHVGFVTVCFGVCGALMALIVGPLVKCISQMAVLILAACANVATCILLFLWTPSPDSVTEYFLFAGVWGMGDAIWWSQVTALYGLMFPNDREAAFSNLYFWSFLGFFLSYSYANYFSVAVKINILLAFLITGMLGYLVGQFKIKCTARKEYIIITEEE